MTKQDFFFSLIRSALWQQPYPHFDMTPGEYHAVMEEAEKQCVQGLIIDCLRSNNMGLQKKCVIHMMKIHNALVSENNKINENLTELAYILDSNSINYLIVKGQTLAINYPKPELRTPGDIDFYVDSDDFYKCSDILSRKWFFSINKQKDNGHHLSFNHNGVSFEMHHYLLKFYNKQNNILINQIINNSQLGIIAIDNQIIKTLTPTLNVFYTFCHLYHHFRGQGVALRQLCDLAMLIHTYHAKINRQQLGDYLKKVGYTKAFRSFGYVLIDKLGLAEEEFPYPLSVEDKIMGNKILSEIWKHGNWGLHGLDQHDKYTFAHRLEVGKIKIGHNLCFFSLSPRENIAILCKSIPMLAFNTIVKAILPWKDKRKR